MASNDLGGYSYEFVSEPPDALKCLICMAVAKEPQQHGECGRVFCKKCLEENKKSKNICPNCKGKSSYFPDTKSDREIKALRVKCDNYDDGCKWEGELGSLVEHENVCDHSLVPCKYEELGCTTKRMRIDLEEHEKDEKSHFQLAMDTLIKLKNTVSKNNGKTITFQVSDFTTILKMLAIVKNQARILSDSFYTSPRGYKMHIEVEGNGEGEGEGTHVSIFACMDIGEYDDELKWPVSVQITFELLNQLQDDDHVKYTDTYTFKRKVNNADDDDNNDDVEEAEEDNDNDDDVDNDDNDDDDDGDCHNKDHHDDDDTGNNSHGCNTLIPHSKVGHNPLRNTQYLKDDTLYFRVQAVVQDYKPWLECTPF